MFAKQNVSFGQVLHASLNENKNPCNSIIVLADPEYFIESGDCLTLFFQP